MARSGLPQTFCESREWDVHHQAKDLAIGAITEASERLENFRFKSEATTAILLGHLGPKLVGRIRRLLCSGIDAVK